jgi:hypothetical protein
MFKLKYSNPVSFFSLYHSKGLFANSIIAVEHKSQHTSGQNTICAFGIYRFEKRLKKLIFCILLQI